MEVPPAHPPTPGTPVAATPPVVTGPLDLNIWDMSQTCYDNHTLYGPLMISQPVGKYPLWPGSGFPPGWKSHPGCSGCQTMEQLLKFAPSTARHPQAKDPNTEYAFTLTMPPDYTPAKPMAEVARLILERGLTNKPYEKATAWAYVLEHTEKGTPHIHGVYKTPSGRRISSKYFMRYWPLWDETDKHGHGFRGGYHSPARHSESYSAYLEKEGAVIKSTTVV